MRRWLLFVSPMSTVWTCDEVIIKVIFVEMDCVMHRDMRAGGQVFNHVCYQERCDCVLTRSLCM